MLHSGRSWGGTPPGHLVTHLIPAVLLQAMQEAAGVGQPEGRHLEVVAVLLWGERRQRLEGLPTPSVPSFSCLGPSRLMGGPCIKILDRLCMLPQRLGRPLWGSDNSAHGPILFPSSHGPALGKLGFQEPEQEQLHVGCKPPPTLPKLGMQDDHGTVERVIDIGGWHGASQKGRLKSVPGLHLELMREAQGWVTGGMRGSTVPTQGLLWC